MVCCIGKSDTNDGRCMIVSMDYQWNDTENVDLLEENQSHRQFLHNRFYIGWPRFESELGKRPATDHLSHMMGTLWRDYHGR